MCGWGLGDTRKWMAEESKEKREKTGKSDSRI